MGNIKVTFRLEQDKDGYPPYAVEDLWARLLILAALKTQQVRRVGSGDIRYRL